jgi:hypothetical protein
MVQEKSGAGATGLNCEMEFMSAIRAGRRSLVRLLGGAVTQVISSGRDGMTLHPQMEPKVKLSKRERKRLQQALKRARKMAKKEKAERERKLLLMAAGNIMAPLPGINPQSHISHATDGPISMTQRLTLWSKLLLQVTLIKRARLLKEEQEKAEREAKWARAAEAAKEETRREHKAFWDLFFKSYEILCGQRESDPPAVVEAETALSTENVQTISDFIEDWGRSLITDEVVVDHGGEG